MVLDAQSIILHHYPMSPYSEKIRLAFGLKGIAWHSVIISPMMPRPDLTPMTGGYRRTPVMQVGADIYCDTQLILRTLERLHPQPSLFPKQTQGRGHGTRLVVGPIDLPAGGGRRCRLEQGPFHAGFR